MIRSFCRMSNGDFVSKHIRKGMNKLTSRHFCSAGNSGSSGTTAEAKKDHTTSSVDDEEVDKFSRISEQWWQSGGEFDALHSLNQLRVPLIRDGLLRSKERSKPQSVSSAEGISPSEGSRPKFSRRRNPLADFRILDVGCGGGILSEPLARLGATVTGLDASAENINMAKLHAMQDPVLVERLTYTCCGVENLEDSHTGYYDGVVASEVLEHVANPREFLTACCGLVKDEGSLFITTLNKSRLSYPLAVVAAEQVFRIVPPGAHDWDKFVPPDVLQTWLEECGFHVLLLHGMLLNPLTNKWSWMSNTSLNYAIHAVKLPS